MTHRTAEELEAGLAEIRRAPVDHGIVALIARRPRPAERDVLAEATLDPEVGLVGDRWLDKPDRVPGKQLTLMGVRAIRLLVPDEQDWPLAGDQLYVDLSLAGDNLPPGTRLAVGEAVIEVSVEPHRGCAKFTQRFGSEAMRWVNDQTGRALNLRGINARIVEGGTVRRGDVIRKL
ncbi:MAG: hypothetical protein WKG01_19970 [Kofleriaceae bacterium]